MDLGGLKVTDLLPIPDNFEIVQNPDNEESAQKLEDEPTISHALAVADHDEKGVAQEAHGDEVKDLGWTEKNERIADPLVGGLPNEELWILIRRFNKQMYDVRELTRPAPGNLDLNIADDEDFSPDKLRAGIERLYMTVIVGLMGAFKHIARLRSWRESRRTAAFCVAYSIAWLLDFIVPLLLLTLTVLIVYPPSREVLFPQAPLALVDSKTGGVQKPKAGVLGSTDSVTGAPENYKGEAVEAEANNFVNSITSVAIATASGKHPQNEPPGVEQEGDQTTDHVPDPTAVAMGIGGAKASAGGKVISKKNDKSKAPMETAMYVLKEKLLSQYHLPLTFMQIGASEWNKMRPTMHIIANITDTWEEFANALSPTPPFPKEVYRLRLAAIVVPLLAASIFITSYMFTKAMWFGVGFGFFGDPIVQPGIRWLNENYPNWQKLLELRNTVLKGVPTNAQLTLTLLRLGEANRAPLPPAPRGGQPPPDQAVDLTDEQLRSVGGDYPLNASDEEIRRAIEHDPATSHETDGADIEVSKKEKKSSKASKMLAAVKSSIKGSVETTLGADHVKAKVGSEHSKRRLGVVPRSPGNQLTGPVDFKCRYHGKRGHCYVSVKAVTPSVGFSIDKSIATEGTLGKDDEQLNPIWSVAVGDIKELKKIGGLGWKSKLVVGWALDREVADSLEIVDKMDNHYVVTAMVLRDELFNRLIAMGGQKWYVSRSNQDRVSLFPIIEVLSL